MALQIGARVRFETAHSDGSIIRYTATVVRVVGDVATVRVPERVRRLPFAPGGGAKFLRYSVAKLIPAIVK